MPTWSWGELGYPWVSDKALARDEWLAIEALRDIVAADLEMGRRVAALPWLTDSLAGPERFVLAPLRDIAFADIELAGRLVDLPWFVDGVTDDEGEGGSRAGCHLAVRHRIGQADCVPPLVR